MSDRYHQEIFEEFKEEFSGLISKVDDWAKEGPHSIRVYFSDGTKAIYNYKNKGIRSVRFNNGSDEDFKRDFRDALVEKMSDCDYTQQTLSKATGISQSMISLYLNKRTIPTAQAINKLAKAFGCTPNDLMWFEDR